MVLARVTGVVAADGPRGDMMVLVLVEGVVWEAVALVALRGMANAPASATATVATTTSVTDGTLRTDGRRSPSG